MRNYTIHGTLRRYLTSFDASDWPIRVMNCEKLANHKIHCTQFWGRTVWSCHTYLTKMLLRKCQLPLSDPKSSGVSKNGRMSLE